MIEITCNKCGQKHSQSTLDDLECTCGVQLVKIGGWLNKTQEITNCRITGLNQFIA